MRVFGVGGIPSGPLKNFIGGSNYGNDMNGNPVTTLAQWQAAVTQLRTPAGHNLANAGTFANPPKWSAVEAVLATTDFSAPADALDANPNATIASLAAMGLVPLAVTQISCKSFDFTADSPSQAGYFGERWELYKHQYMLARWLYVRGIVKQEFWNEVRARAGSAPPWQHPDAPGFPPRSRTSLPAPAPWAPPACRPAAGWSSTPCARRRFRTRTPTSTLMWCPAP